MNFPDLWFLLILGISDDDLRETAYEIILGCAGATGYVTNRCLILEDLFSLWMIFMCIPFYVWKPVYRGFSRGLFVICFLFIRGLIVPSKEKKKDKKSSLIRKLGRSKSGSVVSQSQNAPGLVGLLETMRVQMEVYKGPGSIYLYFDPLVLPLIFSTIMFLFFYFCNIL